MSGLTSWVQGIDLSQLIERIFCAGAALIAISVHESCHGLSAYWLGDDTAKRQGRISLNPLRHLDLFGFVMMVAFRFGWAKPVPVNPYRMTKIKSPKLGMALTAAAGPVSNLFLALLFGLLCCVTGGYYLNGRLYYAGESGTALFYLCQFFASCVSLNAGLAVFNLIPISPLDGSKILAIVLPEKSYAQLMRYERYGFILLALLLFSGILSGPLSVLVRAVMKGVFALVSPVARLFGGG